MKDFLSKLLPVGRKSLLFGVHNFLWHPLTVWLAWVRLYGRPTWKEAVCIFVHDWGYWYCNDMDGYEGERHPELGAEVAFKLFGGEYRNLVLFHSRTYSRKRSTFPSKLCWADKLSVAYDPKWFYLLRAKMSGEIKEFRENGSKYVSLDQSDGEWYDWYRKYAIAIVNQEAKPLGDYKFGRSDYR